MLPKWLWLVMLVLFSLRVATFAAVYQENPGAHVAQDSNTYLQLAESLYKHHAFTSDGEPQVNRTPGYPFFLAALSGLGLNRLATVCIQIMLSVLTLVPVYWLGNVLWGKEVAACAVFVCALDYTSFLASQMLLTESLYTFLLLTAVAFGVSSLLRIHDKHMSFAFLCSVMLALATLVRPISYYLIYVIVVGAMLFEWKQASSWFGIFKKGIVIIVPWLVIVGGWQYRNHIEAGTTELSIIKGINLMRYRGADIIAERDGIKLLAAQERFKRDIPGHDEMTLVERSKSYVNKGSELLAKHPGLALKGQIKGTVRLLAVPGEGDLLRYLGFDSPREGAFGDLSRLPWAGYMAKWLVENSFAFFIFALAFAYLVILYLGAGIGLPKTLYNSSVIAPHILLIAVLVYFVVVSAGPYAYPRLRVPFVPILALYSAAGWCFVKSIRKGHIK